MVRRIVNGVSLVAVALFWAALARADFVFPYDVDYDGAELKAIVVVPDYFAGNFGLWDQSWALIESQRRHPLPPDLADTVKAIAQRWLWNWYIEKGILPPDFEKDPRFGNFILAETLFDGRSAFIIITDRNDITKIFAMFRASSRLLSDLNQPKGYRQYLPHEIRGFRSEEYVNWWQQPRPPKIWWDVLEESVFTFSSDPRRSIEGLMSQVHWFFGAQLELKNWAHHPQIVTDPVSGKRRVRDYMPLVVRLARLHKILMATAVTMDRIPFARPELQRDLDFAIALASKMQKRPVTAAEIGVRAGQYQVECVGDRAEALYTDNFHFVRQFAYEDELFPKQGTRILFAERDKFDEQLDIYAAERPGAVLLPSTTVAFEGDYDSSLPNECIRRLSEQVQPAFFEAYDVQSVHYGIRGKKPRRMP